MHQKLWCILTNILRNENRSYEHKGFIACGGWGFHKSAVCAANIVCNCTVTVLQI